MYLKQSKRKGRVFLSIVENYREGSRVRTKTLRSLGYVDELQAQYPDPVAHFKAQVEELNQQKASENAAVKFAISRNARIATEDADAISLGSALCLAYLDVLGAESFFPDTDGVSTGRIFQLLASARMMHAVPKHQTWNDRSKFPRNCGNDFASVFQALPTVAQEAPRFVAHLNRRYDTLRGRRGLDNVRLVVSNYFFALPDSTQQGGPDETGEAQQARLCVAIDSKGIPLTYRIVSADLSAEEMRLLADDVKTETEARKVTLVAAQFPRALELMQQMASGGNGFVLLLPARETSPQLIKWIYSAEGYAPSKNNAFMLKARTTKHALPEQKGTLSCREIAFKGSDSATDEPFCIISSETQLSDASIFNIYRELWRVHEPFQILSADFISTPYPIDARTHLEAHFALCYTAFFALRMLREDMNWGYNAATVADALLRMEGAYLDENWFLFNYRTPVTDAIQAACGVDQGRRIMSRDDIRHAIATAKRTIMGAR